jgi:hypothetical protein
VLQDIVATKVSQIESAGHGIVRASSDSLSEKKKSISLLNVETSEHAIGKLGEVDVLSVTGKIAMVGQRVEAWARTTGFIEQLAYWTLGMQDSCRL